MPLRAREGDFSVSSPASHNNLGAETAYKEANGWFLKKGYRWFMRYKLKIFRDLYRMFDG